MFGTMDHGLHTNKCLIGVVEVALSDKLLRTEGNSCVDMC